MFGILGVVILAMLIFFPPLPLWQVVALAIIAGMLFLGFGGSLYSIYRMGRDEEPDFSNAVFRCKHCGKRFHDKRMWKQHQNSCVEMKL